MSTSVNVSVGVCGVIVCTKCVGGCLWVSIVRLCVPSVSVGVCVCGVRVMSEQTLTGFLVGHWAKLRHA